MQRDVSINPSTDVLGGTAVVFEAHFCWLCKPKRDAEVEQQLPAAVDLFERHCRNLFEAKGLSQLFKDDVSKLLPRGEGRLHRNHVLNAVLEMQHQFEQFFVDRVVVCLLFRESKIGIVFILQTLNKFICETRL